MTVLDRYVIIDRNGYVDTCYSLRLAVPICKYYMRSSSTPRKLAVVTAEQYMSGVRFSDVELVTNHRLSTFH